MFGQPKNKDLAQSVLRRALQGTCADAIVSVVTTRSREDGLGPMRAPAEGAPNFAVHFVPCTGPGEFDNLPVYVDKGPLHGLALPGPASYAGALQSVDHVRGLPASLAGRRVAVVTDVITTGGSVSTLCSLLQEKLHAEVVLVFAWLDRQLRVGAWPSRDSSAERLAASLLLSKPGPVPFVCALRLLDFLSWAFCEHGLSLSRRAHVSSVVAKNAAAQGTVVLHGYASATDLSSGYPVLEQHLSVVKAYLADHVVSRRVPFDGIDFPIVFATRLTRLF